MSIANTHRDYSADWNTPREWLEWAARTLRVPCAKMFDPCPAGWNPHSDPSGLEIDWLSPSYINHPGAKSRGAAAKWWEKYQAEQERRAGRLSIVWCAFSMEQLRHMRRSPFHMPGWLVMPRTRTSFVWGGPRVIRRGQIIRRRGQVAKSPGNWAVFWSNVEPVTPPVECVIARTS